MDENVQSLMACDRPTLRLELDMHKLEDKRVFQSICVLRETHKEILSTFSALPREKEVDPVEDGLMQSIQKTLHVLDAALSRVVDVSACELEVFQSATKSVEEKASFLQSCANSGSMMNFFCGVFMFDITVKSYLRQQTKDGNLIKMIDLLEGERQLLYGFLKVTYKKQLPALTKRLPALTNEPDRCAAIEKGSLFEDDMRINVDYAELIKECREEWVR